MAPKSAPPKEQKLEMIVNWFRDSWTCHPLIDLEAPFAKAASINKLQVKGFLKELTDESKVQVEKIGSVNRYQCRAGEDVKERKAVLAQLETKISTLEISRAELQTRRSTLKHKQSAAQTDIAQQQPLQQLEALEKGGRVLTAEKDEWENVVAGGVEAMQADAEALKTETNVLTDKIFMLEAYQLRVVGRDEDALESIMREFYGGLYVDGEELAEIEGL